MDSGGIENDVGYRLIRTACSAGVRRATPSPKETPENSPPFQRWVPAWICSGAAKRLVHRQNHKENPRSRPENASSPRFRPGRVCRGIDPALSCRPPESQRCGGPTSASALPLPTGYATSSCAITLPALSRCANFGASRRPPRPGCTSLLV